VKLSVIVPVLNEVATLPALLSRVLAVPLDLEVVVVDDGSWDGTWELLCKVEDPRVRVLRLPTQRGKGAAVHRGLEVAGGDVLLIQDADLEYDPSQYPALLEPLAAGEADVVYGVREWRGLGLRYWPRWLANVLLTAGANLLYGATLSDMETCYKVFRRSALEGVSLVSQGFGVDPELTALFLKKRLPIREVPISYHPRTPREGRKIRWTDFFVVLATLVRLRFR